MKVKTYDIKSLVTNLALTPSRLLPAPKISQPGSHGKFEKKNVKKQTIPQFNTKSIYKGKKHDLL